MTKSLFILLLILSACASTTQSNVRTIHPQESPDLYGRIQRIGERLLPVMDDENRAKYQTGILDTPEVNAFANGPEYQIVFYKGLLDQLDDKSWPTFMPMK